MTPQDRDRYLQWLREVLGREYERLEWDATFRTVYRQPVLAVEVSDD